MYEVYCPGDRRFEGMTHFQASSAASLFGWLRVYSKITSLFMVLYKPPVGKVWKGWF